ncbi:MAG: NAD(+) diphosphatase [Alphaproteobacteria bacterium]|nr:NAD(+) diphosphatase [Alphaproteobacteria bacterium]
MSRINFYSGADIDRAGPLRRDSGYVEQQLASSRARVLPVWRDKNFVQLGNDDSETPQVAWLSIEAAAALVDGPPSFLLLGEKDGIPYFTIDMSHLDEPAPDMAHGAFMGLRDVGGTMEQSDGALLSYAKGLIHWHERHPFCARCGSPSDARDAGHVRVCVSPDCGTSHFPRTDPAVIMLVHKEDRCVLAHNRRNPLPMFSTLAGFVEPGESLEEAVAREVQEEVGIQIGRVRYHSSQPWPFPGNIMLGFHAEAESTEIVVEEAELVEARWFERDEIANATQTGLKLSRSESISRRLIDDWVTGSV